MKTYIFKSKYPPLFILADEINKHLEECSPFTNLSPEIEILVARHKNSKLTESSFVHLYVPQRPEIANIATHYYRVTLQYGKLKSLEKYKNDHDFIAALINLDGEETASIQKLFGEYLFTKLEFQIHNKANLYKILH